MPVPVQPTYPGVYIQEEQSPIHTIVPVPTSITAFLGRALRGPVNQPTLIHSFAEFQQAFGGLWVESTLGFAVQQFFLNGGSDALIVRLYRISPEKGDGRARIPHPGLPLIAQNPGAWGNSLTVRVTRPDEKAQAMLAGMYQLPAGSYFNLAVRDAATGTVETFYNLTLEPGLRQVNKILQDESALVTFDPAGQPGPQLKIHPAQADGPAAWQDPTAQTPAEPASGSDGAPLSQAEYLPADGEAAKTGLYALETADIFNLLYLPPAPPGEDVDPVVLAAAASYCEKRRAILLLDPPQGENGWTSVAAAKAGFPPAGLSSPNAAVYFPNILAPNPLRADQVEAFGPGAAVAGVIARTDTARGLWKAAAGLEATLRGVTGLSIPLSDAENGELNTLGINCLRQIPAAGIVVWGARTLLGADRLASQWKYLPVRRLTLFIEESLYRSTQWAVFEPNDEPLWSQLRLNVGVFMYDLFRQGAFQGQSPNDAYFVKCDSSTTTQSDIDRRIVNIIVGFAPLKPAEFIILYIQQITG